MKVLCGGEGKKHSKKHQQQQQPETVFWLSAANPFSALLCDPRARNPLTSRHNVNVKLYQQRALE